jgi:hypothetical protein
MLLKSFLVLLIGCLAAFTQSNLPQIALSGTVTDGDGAVIEGAEVSLVNLPSLTSTTDENGMFIIEHEVGVKKPYGLSIENSKQAGIKGNLLQFTVTSETKSGLIEIFSTNGRRSALIPLGKLQAGTHKHEIPSLPSGFYIMNVTLDQSVTTLRLVNSGSKMHVNNTAKSIQQNNALRKTAQTVDDTLVVSKEDYITTKVALDTYIKEDIEIVMVEEGQIECKLSDLPDPSALKENQKLPNPFAFFDGTEITKKSQWPCLRKEILNMAYKYMYGQMPPFEAPDVEVEGSVSGSGVTANITYNGKSETMNFRTSGSGDILLISMGDAGIGPGRGYSYRTLDVNTSTPGSWGGVCKKLFNMDPCGEIALGWGCNILCRAIASDPDGGIDTNKIMTTGCSNTAKAAFLSAVFCEGIDLSVVVESGGFGAASPRVAEYLYKGPGPWVCNDPPQGLWSPDYGNQWLAGPYMDPDVASWVIGSNSGNVYKLPYDHHMLMACVAPRYLCVCSNSNGPNSWCHLNGTGSAVAAWAAKPVFKALGVADHFAFNIPNAYSHCSGAQQNHGSLVNEFFKRVFDGDENAETDVMNIPAGNVQLDPSEWKDIWVDWDMNKTLD